MKKQLNYVQWCMDSCRWDTFTLADTPNMDAFTDYRMVYSRAGITCPSLFGVFMNLSWYESRGATPVPELNRWVWIPSVLQKMGYHTVLVTNNPMLELYRNTFSRGFTEYIMTKGCVYHADVMVDTVQQIYNTIDKPKYVFLLFMETHQPYPYRKGLSNEYLNENYRPVTRQIKAVEALDKEFARAKRFLQGTNTDTLIFSDHGDLDLRIEGHQGHGPSKFHDKLFEIPLGRATL